MIGPLKPAPSAGRNFQYQMPRLSAPPMSSAADTMVASAALIDSALVGSISILISLSDPSLRHPLQK